MGAAAVFKWLTRKYPRPMGIARRPEEHIRPLPRLQALDEWANHWVAVKDDQVIAAALTSRELAYRLREMGEAGRGAVMQFVHPDTDAYVVGAG